MLPLKVTAFVDVGKKMTTKRQAGSELVTCEIQCKNVRVSHQQIEELAGLPLGALAGVFDEAGAPRQRMSFLLPKRGLVIKGGKLQLRRESGAIPAELLVATGIAADLRFNLDTPDERGPTAMFGFTLLWKAAGDEVSDIEPLLACGQNREKAWLEMTFEEENTTQPLFETSAVNVTAEKAAGHRSKLDRKRKAAGEQAPESGSASNGTDEPKKTAPKKQTSLADLEQEAQEVAKRHPRKEPHAPRGRH